MRRDFDFLWVGCNSHFILSVIGLIMMLGMRSYAAFSCPTFGRIGAVSVLSALALVLSVLQADEADLDGQARCDLADTIGRYPGLVWARMRSGNVLTIISALLAAISVAMTADGFYHVWSRLYAAK